MGMLRLSGLLVLLFVSSTFAADPATQPAATRPPAADIIFLPLHVHVLSAKDRPDIDCSLKDEDLDRILGKVNKVWRQAGIQFMVQPIRREQAVKIDEFDKQKEKIQAGGLGAYRLLAPPETRDLTGLHVYYVHELPPNGVYIGGNLAFVKETASLRKVEGGIDEPLPRVTSHELGHGLGLPHRQDKTNLMASGTTGTSFNEAEIAISRGKAKAMKGSMTRAQVEEQIKSADGKSVTALKKLLEGLD
jgi:hypothetical protein